MATMATRMPSIASHPGHAAHLRAAAGIEADIPAQQRHEQDIGARRGLGQSDGRGELRFGEPALFGHQVAVHVGRGGDGATNGQQGERGEMGEEIDPVANGRHHAHDCAPDAARSRNHSSR